MTDAAIEPNATPDAPETPPAATGTEDTTPATPAASDAATADSPDTGSLDADAANRELAKTRKEAAATRVKLREFEEAEEARRVAALSEKEQADDRAAKAEAKAAELEAVIATQQREAAIRLAAKHFADPADAIALLAGTTLTDDAAIVAAVTSLAEAKPHLIAKHVPQAGQPSNPARPGGAASTPSNEERYARVTGAGGSKLPWRK